MSDVAQVARTAWAKSVRDETGVVIGWLPLVQHLDDTAAVAERLWDDWLTPSVRSAIAGSLDGDERDARRLAVFLAGVHDVGKASPAFAVQVDVLADRMRLAGLPMPVTIPNDERRKARHELVGATALESWLREAQGWESVSAQQLGVIVGGHHGVPPEHGQPTRVAVRGDLVGTGSWLDVQRYLLGRASGRFELSAALPAWNDLQLSQPAQVLLTGLVIVADWIASNGDLFPLADLDDECPTFDRSSRLVTAWDALRLPEPWQPALTPGLMADVLSDRFGLPARASIRPVQRAAVDLASTMNVPGIMVIEAPMGEGKTEAALLAAEVLAARSGAGGCFVGLPTQATTDAMFGRVLDWMSRLPDARLAAAAAEGGAVERSVMLAHGKASLNATFRELRMTGMPNDVAEGEIDTVVHSWLRGRKKGPLADFVVGTIDQLLFSSLRARHLALRHLGLARKVVIVDEVHSYDAYMDVYLSRALEWLGAYGVPVILLSATLPLATRKSLVKAYESGVESGRRRTVNSSARRIPSWAVPPADSEPHSRPVLSAPYPAITTLQDGSIATAELPTSGRIVDVITETADDDLDALEPLLADALAEGGCALVVRNTVSRAQTTARRMSERFGDEVVIAHSRFIGHDRIAKDMYLRTCFGPPDATGGSAARPSRKIVVATQVVEQSLDVDFDLLVTDLAPIDLMLQRIGRLHRHQRGDGESGRPEPLRHARCVVVGVLDWSASPPELDRGGRAVYQAHMLYRSAALITELVAGPGKLVIPDDIPGLVQRAYSNAPLGPESWQDEMAHAADVAEQFIAGQRSRANTFRLGSPGAPGEPILGWLRGNVGEADDSPEGQAQVRDSEDSLEVIVLQRSADGQLRVPDWLDAHPGQPLPLNCAPSDSLARHIVGCSIRLPTNLVRGRRGDAVIAALEKNWHPELQTSPLLAGQLILELDDDQRGEYGPYAFHYDVRYGLEVSERE